MKQYFFCPVSDPLFLGCSISAPSLDAAMVEYLKLYGTRPCVVYDAPRSSLSRDSFLSNLKFVDSLKKSKLLKLKNILSTNFIQAGFF